MAKRAERTQRGKKGGSSRRMPQRPRLAAKVRERRYTKNRSRKTKRGGKKKLIVKSKRYWANPVRSAEETTDEIYQGAICDLHHRPNRKEFRNHERIGDQREKYAVACPGAKDGQGKKGRYLPWRRSN